MARNTFIRSLHDMGLAAWFGGTLANAVALNTAAAQPRSDNDKGQVANVGWDHWTPVNAAAIGAHIVGATGLLMTNRRRAAEQEGVGRMSVAKTALTGAALAVTAYSRMLGRKVSARTDVPVASATKPTVATPQEVAAAQNQLRVLQWAVPALTGALVGVSALAGEQQRPSEVKKGRQIKQRREMKHALGLRHRVAA
jgi:hypothetical protein